jgi:hypothetical protein
MEAIRIAAAGNVEAPAYLALVKRGFNVSCDNQGQWSATGNGCHFIASSPLELLGLAGIFDSRGANWRASDQEIEAFLKLMQNEI